MAVKMWDLGNVLTRVEQIKNARYQRDPSNPQNQLNMLRIQQAQAELDNPQSSETFFGNPLIVKGPDGKPIAVQLGNRGSVNTPDLPGDLLRTTREIKQGDKIITVDQFGNFISERPVNLGPSQTLDYTFNRAQSEALGKQAGQFGGGFSLADDSGPPRIFDAAGQGRSAPSSADVAAQEVEAEAVARTRADRAANKGKAQDSAQAAKFKLNTLKQEIADARKLTGAFTTGFFGAIGQYIPGTDAYDLSEKLTTIKSNLGFDRLQQMRDQSPTGGALGQVSEREGKKLEAVWGSLEQAQSKSQFLTALKRVEDQIDASYKAIADAYRRDYGEPWDGESIAPGMVIEINPQEDEFVDWNSLQ